MTIQEDVARVRALGVSRRTLAALSGLSEGKIWRIENKGNASDVERAALQPHLTTALTIGHTSSATSRVDPTVVPTVSQTADVTPAVAQTVVLDRPPVVVDWPALQEAAREVEGLTPPPSGPDRSLGFRLVSNSELQTFKDCRRRWWLAWYRQLRSRFQSPVGVRAVGSRLHRALMRWYVPATALAVDPREELERLIVLDWTLVCQTHGGEEHVSTELRRRFTDDANLERVMLEGYVQHIAETGIDAELEVISSEAYVEADITRDVQVTGNETPLKIIGRLDVRVRRQLDGARLFIDHKSVGNFTEPAALLPLDEQMLHYHLLEWLNTDSADERCDGALYNMLRRVKRTPQARPPFYQRIEVHHNRHAVESFKRRLVATVLDMRDVEERLDSGDDHRDVAYPRPSRDCRWKCDFFQVCGLFDDDSRAEDMLTQYYEQSDPLSYYDQESNEE